MKTLKELFVESGAWIGTIILMAMLLATFTSCEESFPLEEMEMEKSLQHPLDTVFTDSIGTYPMQINARTEAGGYIYEAYFKVIEKETGKIIYHDYSKTYKINLRLDTSIIYIVEMNKQGYETVQFDLKYVWNKYVEDVYMSSTGEFYEFTFGAADLSTHQPFKEFAYKIKEYAIDGWVQEGEVTDSLATIQLDYGIEYDIYVYKEGYKTASYRISDQLTFTDKIYIGMNLEED